MGFAIKHSPEPTLSQLTHATWETKDWMIEKKVPKTLGQFNGRTESYTRWYERVRNHVVASNEGWGRVLDLLEK